MCSPKSRPHNETPGLIDYGKGVLQSAATRPNTTQMSAFCGGRGFIAASGMAVRKGGIFQSQEEKSK